MRFAVGLLTNSHGVYILRKKVPARLERAVAQGRGDGKPKQTFQCLASVTHQACTDKVRPLNTARSRPAFPAIAIGLRTCRFKQRLE